MSMKKLLALMTMAVAGCASAPSDGVTIPRLPAWVAPADPTPLPALRVVAECHIRYPGVPVYYADSTYTLVSKKWLDAYMTWCWEAAKDDGIAYTPEAFDCDDFADGFRFFANRAAARAGIHAAPLVCEIAVQLSATERHELNAVATDEGIFVVEPQPDAGPFRLTPLDKYGPRILAIAFGPPSS